MTTAMGPRIVLDDSFARDLSGLYEPWQAATAPAPELVLFNEDLASELGLDAAELRSAAGVALLVGNAVPDGSTPIAQAYAGHQFGGYSPRLGDGRALLVGELVDGQGRRRDLHLKGSGRTPFARGGDGKAALGPMVREYVIGEAMHALGIPTTRALAVTTTGEHIQRDDGHAARRGPRPDRVEPPPRRVVSVRRRLRRPHARCAASPTTPSTVTTPTPAPRPTRTSACSRRSCRRKPNSWRGGCSWASCTA